MQKQQVKEVNPHSKNNLVCNICQEVILVGEEEYCGLSQYKKDGELFKTSHYHVTCYRDKFLANKKLKADSELFMHEAFQTIDAIKKQAGIN